MSFESLRISFAQWQSDKAYFLDLQDRIWRDAVRFLEGKCRVTLPLAV